MKIKFSGQSPRRVVSLFNQPTMPSLVMAIIRKIRFGVWLGIGKAHIVSVFSSKLCFNVELLRRHIPAGSGCDCCGAILENTLQVLCDCMAVKRFWNYVDTTQKCYYSQV